MKDSALIEGLRRHDPAAVRYLSECCLPTVWRFACARVRGDQHLAEDILSEAVLALLRAASDESMEIGSPISWLRTVVANKVADHFRAAARVQHLIEQAKQTVPELNTQDAAQQQQLLERRQEVRQVLDSIPDQGRLALEWKYVDRLSVREIAGRLDVTEKAAESILFRARNEFRQRMIMKDNGHSAECCPPSDSQSRCSHPDQQQESPADQARERVRQT
ncbi:MAG: sigma-70 family RNA polymerase sigma factor [Planctomyces sp.]|nr:sigma-70 family RNA polymerase sigma factor [Planctomyces sp.]